MMFQKGKKKALCGYGAWVDQAASWYNPENMERVIPEQYSLSKSAQPRPITGMRVVGLILVYAFFVLAGAVFGSLRLYEKARWAVVNSSPIVSSLILPAVDNPSSNPDTANGAGVSAVPPSDTVPDTPSSLAPINILLLGTDERPDESGPPRTDTIILLTLDPQTNTAGMLSLPRDLLVPIPFYNFNAKINTAYGYGESYNYSGGGEQLVMDTVSQLIGRPVDYYIQVNFNGFVQVVDLIDGIDIVVPDVIYDEQYPTNDYGYETFYLDAGLQHLDGETALKYARTRHGDSDYGRARRQQAVIRAVADKVLSLDMIPTLLPKALTLVSTMRNSIGTNIPLLVQYEIATYMQAAALQDIRQEVIDKRYGQEFEDTPEWGWVLVPDREKVRAALASFFKPAAPATATPTGATVDLRSVRIEVLNGTGQPGIAALTRTYLEAQGWQVVAIGDADRGDYTKTMVVNYGVPDLIIDRVSKDLALQPGFSRLQGLNSAQPIDLRIVVGRDILPLIQ